MKKLLVVLSLLIALPMAAQDYSKLQSQVAKSDAEIQDAKKMTQPKVWMNRGELFLDIWTLPTKSIMAGMSHKDIKMLLAKEKITSSKTEDIEGTLYEVDVYPDKELYYDSQGVLSFWKVTSFAVEKPLFKALEAYLKAAECDVKGSYSKKIKEALLDLQTKFNTDALAAYSLRNYGLAMANFEASLACVESPLVGKTDSLIIYYTGIVSRAAGDNEKATTYFGKAVQIGYHQKGDIYATYAEALTAAGDTTKALNALTEGLSKYPTNQSIIIGLINTYLQKGDDPKKILPYVKQAQENDPNNASLNYAEGIVYEQLKDSDNAVKAYKAAIAKDQNNFFANYSLGALYFNQAVETQKKAADELDDKKYEALLQVFDQQLKEALPYLEKAYELNANERAVVESLKTIYFRLREEGPEMQKKYEYYNEKLQSM